jgi:hypothetical protein
VFLFWGFCVGFWALFEKRYAFVPFWKRDLQKGLEVQAAGYLVIPSMDGDVVVVDGKNRVRVVLVLRIFVQHVGETMRVANELRWLGGDYVVIIIGLGCQTSNRGLVSVFEVNLHVAVRGGFFNRVNCGFVVISRPRLEIFDGEVRRNIHVIIGNVEKSSVNHVESSVCIAFRSLGGGTAFDGLGRFRFIFFCTFGKVLKT